MRMSDAITAYILRKIEEDVNGCTELQRNELAGEIGCVPSQINYVLGSRFTPEQGYIVESRRGGGGYIRIQRIRFSSEMSMVSHVIHSIGTRINEVSARAVLQNLIDCNVLSTHIASVIAAAVSDKSYRNIPISYRDYLRADLLKQMLSATMVSSK